MKKIICTAILLLSISGFCQELAGSIPLKYKQQRDVFQIVNAANKDVTLFLSDKITIKAIKLDTKMQVIDSMSGIRPRKEFNDMIGYVDTDNSAPIVFWSTSNRKKIVAQQYDFATKKTSIKDFSLVLKGEELLQEFTANGKFYMMSIIKKTSELILYAFDASGAMEEKTISLSHIRFFTNDYERVELYGILDINLLPFERAPLLKIIPGNPIALTESAKKRKCYITEKEIVLTFDTNLDYTQMISIDLDTYVATEKTFKMNYIESAEKYLLNSNSFLIDDKLFQIKTSASLLYLNVKDKEDKTLESFTVAQDTEIPFKNTEVIQENGTSKNKRILEKSSQFLRKVNNSNSGISCYRIADNYILTVGSVSQETNNSAMMYGAMFGVAGVIIAAAISNPTFESFSSYANRKVVYTNGLFDINGKHIEGKIEPFAFDKIRTYLESRAELASMTLFGLDNSYFLGYYDNMERKYSLRKFQD